MQEYSKTEKLIVVSFIAQPVTLVATVVAGMIFSSENGYNGMQAIFVIPIIFVLLFVNFFQKILHDKFISIGKTGYADLLDKVIVLIYILAILVDLGIFLSAFLTEYYINLFSFPPTILKL